MSSCTDSSVACFCFEVQQTLLQNANKVAWRDCSAEDAAVVLLATVGLVGGGRWTS